MKYAFIALVVWFIGHMVFNDYLEYQRVKADETRYNNFRERESESTKLLYEY